MHLQVAAHFRDCSSMWEFGLQFDSYARDVDVLEQQHPKPQTMKRLAIAAGRKVNRSVYDTQFHNPAVKTI